MNINEQEFQFMVEGITSDLIQLLIDRKHFTLPQAVDAIYGSEIYKSLQRPETGLYFQSAGYVFSLLEDEFNARNSHQTSDSLFESPVNRN